MQAVESPLKAEKFWAEMRSTCYLFSKSTWPSNEQAAQLIQELRHILGKRIIAYPQTLQSFGINQETPYKFKKTFLGLDRHYNNTNTEESDRRFLKFMATKAAEAQKANWCWRITQEAEEKQKMGWYPFFVTLTIDPKKCRGQEHVIKERRVAYDSPEDLWKTGREFRLYIRSLAELSAELCGHPPPRKKTADYGYRPESDYITYAGVIEHGKTNEHHHAHIMIWMREIPSRWKVDPNHGKMIKSERECKQLRPYWYWSSSEQKPALYFRTKGDIWQQLGHCTPIDRETGKPIKINPVEAVGNYVTKYMQKGTKVWHHRMKCTRNLGMRKIQKLINSLERSQLEPLTWKPETSGQLRSLSSIHSVPQGLIRSTAKRRIFALDWEQRSLDLKTLMQTNYDHYKRMLRSVRDGARPDRMRSAEFYDWVRKHQEDQKGYCKKKLREAHKLLAEAFPKKLHRVQPVVLGGNEFGFTHCI